MEEFLYRRGIKGLHLRVALPQGIDKLLDFNMINSDPVIVQSEVQGFINDVLRGCVSQQQMSIVVLGNDIMDIQNKLIQALPRAPTSRGHTEASLYSMPVHSERQPLLSGQSVPTGPSPPRSTTYVQPTYPPMSMGVPLHYHGASGPVHSTFPNTPAGVPTHSGPVGANPYHQIQDAMAPLFAMGQQLQEQYREQRSQRPITQNVCYGCGGQGHYVADCIKGKDCDAHGSIRNSHTVGACKQYSDYLRMQGLPVSMSTYNTFKAQYRRPLTYPRNPRVNARERERGREWERDHTSTRRDAPRLFRNGRREESERRDDRKDHRRRDTRK